MMTTTDVAADRLLSPIALDFLWEALDAGEPPYPIEIQSHGATMDSRAALRRRIREELVASQLLDHTGRLEPQLEEWLGVLAQADMSIDSVFLPARDAMPVLALAAAGRNLAVLAVQQQEGLRLREIPRDSMVSAIIGLLPGAPRGTEPSVSMPAEELSTSRALPGERESTTENRKALARITAQPNLRGGQIAVNSRSDMRGRRRSPVLSWFDNESGRYLTQSRDGWVTVAPAEAATLRKRISEMMTETTSDRR